MKLDANIRDRKYTYALIFLCIHAIVSHPYIGVNFSNIVKLKDLKNLEGIGTKLKKLKKGIASSPKHLCL